MIPRLAIVFLLSCAAVSAADGLMGAGATFPYPLYQKWIASFTEKIPGEITYRPVGSSAGIDALRKGEVDFAASDAPLSAEELASLGNSVRQIPTVVGGVVPIYNVDGILRDLRFTPEILAGIYLGKITRWDDALIKAANRGVNLPRKEIAVVHRSDGSGTTYIWTDYLAKVSTAWRSQPGVGLEVKWPVGAGAAGNEGVAGLVARTPNSIGYVEFIYALQAHLSYGSVRNAAGHYVQAGLSTLSVSDTPDASAYPISAFTYLLVPKNLATPGKTKLMDAFIEWALTSGQKQCAALGYAPLPAEVAGRELGVPPPASSDSGERYWVSGQANFISQGHPGFRSPYSGDNSLSPGAQFVTSRVLTLYTGFRLTPSTDFLFDLETAGGHGIGEALGVAGFTNLDVVRNPSLGQAPYVARLMLHQMIPLSSDSVPVERGPFQLAGAVPSRRLDIRIGKMSTVDWFDVNSIGSDSHLQFMNWAVDNNGAYDYAADTRGYTYGLVLEYTDRDWTFRFGEMLMPKTANGTHLDADLARARAENYEFELRRHLLRNRLTVVRPLAFVNHADMGSYREAIAAYLSGEDKVPDVTLHREQGRVKYGFGLNLEQELTDKLRAYGRFSWNEGHNESYAYTEIDQSYSGGVDLRGNRWRRRADKLGVAVVSNAISGDHREYLALGGDGFLLGDGRLNYSRENIIETYYTAHLWHGVSASFDLQRVWNPGYNRDRGPVLAAAIRLHLEGVLFSRGM